MNTIVERLKKALPLLGILIALALPLMFVLEDFVRDAIVLPLAYLAWLLRVILEALPQGLCLSAVVILGIYVAVRSLSRESKDAPTAQPTLYRSEGAVALWIKRIGRVSEGAYSRERINFYLGQLLTRTIAHEEHLSPREILHAIDSGELVLPPEIRAYIDLAYRRGYPTSPKWYRRLATFVTRLLPGHAARDAAPSRLEAEIAPALSYIESRLRIDQTEETSE